MAESVYPGGLAPTGLLAEFSMEHGKEALVEVLGVMMDSLFLKERAMQVLMELLMDLLIALLMGLLVGDLVES